MEGHDGEAAAAEHGAVRTQIPDGLVALIREFYGRGPDRTKTYSCSSPAEPTSALEEQLELDQGLLDLGVDAAEPRAALG
jgi:hypothetical protein